MTSDTARSPQLENGYIRIATEIWRELARFRISGEERMILDCILAKTYGFNKKTERITYSQFSEYTEINRPACARAIRKLLSKKIINVPRKGSYQFNKDYSLWLKLSKKITAPKVLSKKIIKVINIDNKVLSKKITPIYIQTIKDNIKTGTYDPTWGKEISLEYSVSEEDVRLLWERMVNSRIANGKPYKDWKRGFIAWLIPSIQEGKIAKVLSDEDEARRLGFDINKFNKHAE